jgi:4-aminobutyrate aminotransferase/(S)-3-amino-2-methylpropionate transaminase
LPLAAVTGRADIMDVAHAGGIGGTYSGNPVACAAALGVFEAVESDQLLTRAQLIGELMVRELRDIAQGTDVIGDIRGRGAMIAAELVVPGTREPNRDAVAAITRYCQNHGVLTLTAGTFGNVLRYLPPLAISDELLVEAFGVIRDAIATL